MKGAIELSHETSLDMEVKEVKKLGKLKKLRKLKKLKTLLFVGIVFKFPTSKQFENLNS